MNYLKRIPQKLQRKFEFYEIQTIEDLQSKFFEMTNAKGFGGIALAELERYMEKEGIPNPLRSNEVPFFHFTCLPPPSLRQLLIDAAIDSIQKLKRSYHSVASMINPNTANFRLFINYMSKLDLSEEANVLRKEYSPKMILQNIPKKLQRKFEFFGILTVKDLQTKYYELIYSKGFGGIFLAELKKYMVQENIDVPSQDESTFSIDRRPGESSIFDFKPYPPTSLRKSFIMASVYSIEDLKKQYKSFAYLPSFGAKKMYVLIEYMTTLCLFEEANDLKLNYLPRISIFKGPNPPIEKHISEKDFGKDKVRQLIELGNKDFVYSPQGVGVLNSIFTRLDIKDYSDLIKNFDNVKDALGHKRKTIEEFQFWLDDSIDFCIAEEISEPYNLIAQLDEAFESYVESLDEKERIVSDYFIGDEEKNYSDIAIPLNISRERSRQLCEKQKETLKRFLSGCTLNCLPSLSKQIAKHLCSVRKKVESETAVSLHTFSKLLDSISDKPNNLSIKIIKKLCKIWNFYYCTIHRDNTVFITDSSETSNSIINIESTIIKRLQEKIYPISRDDLIAAIKLELHNFSDRNILLVLESIKSIEIENGLVSLKLKYFTKLNDMAAFILYKEKQPLKFQTIIERINDILEQQNAKTYNREFAGAATFSTSAELVPVGRTGYWVLKNFSSGIETRTLREQIIDIFIEIGRPLSINEIKDCVKGNYAEQSVATVVNMYNGKDFLPISHRRYILSSWELLYQKDIRKPQKRTFSNNEESKSIKIGEKILSSVINYFENKNSFEEPMDGIVKFIHKIDGFEKPSIYKAISESSIFTKEIIGRSGILFYKKTSEDIMNDLLNKKKITELLVSLLEKNDSNFTILGNNPYTIHFRGKLINVYVKNITSTDIKAKERGNYRVQLPYRDEFEDMKSSQNPFVFLGYDSKHQTFAAWYSDVIKAKLNTKSNVSLYPRILQMENARTNLSYEIESVNGEGDIIAFPIELLSDFILENRYTSKDKITVTSNFNYEAEYEQNGLLLKITNPSLIGKLSPILKATNINRFDAFQIVWDFYGDKYPKMELKHWGALIDKLTKELRKNN